MHVHPIQSTSGSSFEPNAGRREVKVERPHWAISNLVKKAWVGMTVVATATLVLAAVTLVVNPIGAVSLIATVAAVSLAVLLGVGAFQTIRQANILPDILQRVANAIHAHVVELFCVVGSGVLYPAAYFGSDPKGPVPAGQRPILFVHGYLHNGSGGAYMKARFRHAGIGPFYSINLGNPVTLKSIEEYSRAVQNKVDAIVAETGCDKVVVIGHSMGGIAAADAATRHDTNGHIDQLITLGSPLQGTRTAYFGAGKCAKEMRRTKKNPFISGLIERIRAHRGRIHSFHSQSDLVVRPNKAAVVEGTESTLFPDHGHLVYMYSDKAIDKMITIIRGGNAAV